MVLGVTVKCLSRSLEKGQVVDLWAISYLNEYIIEGDKMFCYLLGKVVSEEIGG